MKNLRLPALLISTALIIILIFITIAHADETIKVVVNDLEISFPDAKPFIDQNKRTQVPVRFVAEAMNAKVDWDIDSRTVIIERGNTTLSMTIGIDEIILNGEKKPMDTMPVIIDKRTFVPLRYISEGLEAEVVWDSATRTVHILDTGEDINNEDYFIISDDNGIFGSGILLDYLGPGGNVVIPDNVESITFWPNKSSATLTGITIPKSVTNIESSTFFYCSSLTSIKVAEDNAFYTSIDGVLFTKDLSVIICYPAGKTAANYTIPQGVQKIKNSAFSGCSFLTSINIPESVIDIEASAFYECIILSYFEIDKNNANYTTIDGIVFSKDLSELVCYPAGKAATDYTVPQSVQKIGDYAFISCSTLNRIIISNNLKRISVSAFHNCTSLTSINIPVDIDIIGDGAFYGCKSLNNITIPEGVTRLGTSLFDGCASLSSIIIPAGILETGEFVFRNCKSLTSITIDASLSKFNRGMFSGCTSLSTINIPESVTYFSSDVFSDCNSLSDITIPKGVEKIYNNTFSNCASLINIKIPKSIDYIDTTAFVGCDSLVSIKVDNENANYKDIDGVLFTKDLTELFCYPAGRAASTYSIPTNVKRIFDRAFCGCNFLASITIPTGISAIEEATFFGCVSLANISMPGTVSYIGDYAFANCVSLSSITIPESIQHIAPTAFNACPNLTIHGAVGSFAQLYAKEQGIPFEPL